MFMYSESSSLRQIVPTLLLSLLILLNLLAAERVSAVETEQSHHFCGPYTSEALDLPNVVPALYGVVSGAPGEERNWQLLRNLFAPSGTITPLFHKNGEPDISVLSADEFVALNKHLFKDTGFYETETHNQTIVVGHMATVISAYESRETPQGKVYSRGVNTFQLVNDGRRWCVISVTWDSDKGGHDITDYISKIFTPTSN